MRSLLDWRDHSYFEQRKDHYFLVDIIMLKVCKLSMFKSSYWFEYPGIHTKSITTPCVSLNDLHGTPVYYEGNPEIKGIIGGYGVLNTSFMYVYWGRVPMKDKQGKQLGFPCALPDNFDLKLFPD